MPKLKGLRPHEQRLVERWEAEKNNQVVLARKNSAFQAVQASVIQLYNTQASWGEDPRRLKKTKIKCQTCKDAGSIMPNVSLRNIYSRRSVSCPDCGMEFIQKRRRARIHERWPVNKNLINVAKKPILFDHIENEDGKDWLSLAFESAKRFATDWPKGGILTFDGPPGTGKTHLSAKIYRMAWLTGRCAIFVTGRQVQKYSVSFDDGEDEKKRRDLTSCDLLVIDECDHIKVTPDGAGHVEQYLFSIVNDRIKHGLCTVLTGNHIAKRIPKAILSRCNAEGSLFIGTGNIPDARPIYEGDASWISQI